MFTDLTHRTELLRLMGRVSIIESEQAIEKRLASEKRHKRHILEQLGVRKNIPAPKELAAP